MTTKHLSTKSAALLQQLLNDSDNWSGMPLYQGNQEDNGNLTDLKKKGYLETDEDGDDGCIWIMWTDLGKKTAEEMGIELGFD